MNDESTVLNEADDSSATLSTHLTKTSFAAMGGVLLSRASGVLRTVIVNAIFGAATLMDAFNAAFRFPNSLRDLFADGALSSAFITSLVEVKEKGIEEERQLIATVIGFFGVVTLVIAVLGVIYAEPFIALVTDERFRHTGGLPIAVTLFRILAFYLPLTMLNAVAVAVLGVLGHTFRAMNGSLFLSVGMVLGALVFSPLLKEWHFVSILGLAMGAMLGVLMQMIYQIWPLFRLGLVPLPNINPIHWWSYQPLRDICKRMSPRVIGQGAMTVALAINTYFATQIGTGVLTYIVTAIIIIQVPIGLFGVATGFASLPLLTSMLIKGNVKQCFELLKESLRTALWLATFTVIGFSLLIVPFYIVLFQHGKITFDDSIQNCIAICAYSIGIIFASSSKVLVNALYALNATRQIIYNALAYLLVNACLSAILAPRWGVVGLGISFGTATAVDCWLNYLVVSRRFKHKIQNASLSIVDEKLTYKVVGFTILAFMSGLLGVWLVEHFWNYFDTIVGIHLNFWISLIILLLGGIVLMGLYCFIIYRWGPKHLKNALIYPFSRLRQRMS